MRNLVLAYFVFYLMMPLVIKGQNYQWAKGFGESNGASGRGITIDNKGHSYITGQFFDTIDFDPGLPISNLIGVGTTGDIFILKLDSLGNYVWAKKISGLGYMQVQSIVVDDSCNVYTTGFFSGTIDCDPDTGSFYLNALGNGYGVFISKLDSSGKFIWAKSISNYGAGLLSQELRVDKLGNVYVSGNFNGSIDFDPGPGFYSLSSSNGLYDSFLLKLNSQGDFIWARRWGNNITQYAYPFTVDSIGNVYITSHFYFTFDFDPGPGTHTIVSTGGSDAFILKLNSLGNFSWVQTIGGPNDDGGSAIEMDSNGDIITIGSFKGIVDFDPNASTYNLNSSTLTCGYILKLDNSGGFEWVRKSTSQNLHLKLDNSNNIYTTGTFQGIVDFNPGPGFLYLNCSSWFEMFISKVDHSGVYLWTKTLPGLDTLSGCFPYRMTIDFEDNIYFTGETTGVVDFDPDAGVSILTSKLTNNAFVLKLGLCNTILKSSSNITLCSGESATISASGAYSYTWHPSGGNTSSIVVSPNQTSTYTVTGPKSSDCIGTSLITIGVDECTSLLENNSSLSFIKVYPNPNNGDFLIESTETMHLKLVNELGQVIITFSLNIENNFKVSISDLFSGVYFLTSEKGTMKIVVLK